MPYALLAQEKLTLSQAISSALANRKIIRSGKSDQLVRRLQTNALYKKYLPQLNVEYAYQYNPILQTSILPIGVFNPTYPPDAVKSVQFGAKWSQTTGITLNQPLIDLSINRQISEAKIQERIAAASQAQTEYDLAYAVAQAYFDIDVQDAMVRSAVADTNRTWVSYKLLNSRFEEKRLLKSELNKAKINHNIAVQQYQNAISQLIEDKVFLLFLMGKNDVESAEIFIENNGGLIGDPLNQNVTLNSSKIPELQQLQLNADMAEVQAKVEKARSLPTVNLKGYLGANQYTNVFDPMAANSWFGLSYVGVNLKCPLPFSEGRRNKVEQLKLQSDQYYLQREDKTAQFEKDAIIAKLRMNQVASQLKTQEQNIALSLESISLLQIRVSEGQESTSDLNEEEAYLQKLRSDYQVTKRQYWLYLLDYLKASGNLEFLWKN